MASKKKKRSRASRQTPPREQQPTAVTVDAGVTTRSDNAWVSSSADLQRAQAFWQVGDWEGLMALSEEPLEDSHQRVDLTLMIAVAASQLGYSEKSRVYVRKALEWGASREQVRKVLLSGAYNTLGRASLLAGSESQSRGGRYLSDSAQLALGDGAVPALVKARIREQLEQMQVTEANRAGLPYASHRALEQDISHSLSQHPRRKASGLERVRELPALAGGYVFDAELGLYLKEGADTLDDFDGAEADHRLLDIVRQASDVSLFSAELREVQIDRFSNCHLSADRANLLRPFAHTLAGSQVLELGCGCGAVARYLGELGACVTAVESSPRRAAIAAERCRDLPNVQVVLDQPELFSQHRQFDVVLAIGTLEQCPQAADAIDPVQQFLQRAWASLKADGLLIAVADNQLGLQYLAGAPEAHGHGIMAGIEDRYSASAPRSFGRGELASRVEKAGFRRAEVYSVFPDYQRPRLLVAPGAPGKAPACWNLTTLVNRAMSAATKGIPRPFLSLERFGALATKNNLLSDVAGGHLLMGYKSPEGRTSNTGYLASYFSPGSDDETRETRFNLEPASESGLVVSRHGFQESLFNPDAATEQTHSYYPGEVHVDALHAIIQQPGWTMDQVCQWVALWLRALTKHVVATDLDEVTKAVADTYYGQYNGWLPADYLAASPDHMIRHADGSVRFIGGSGSDELVPLARVLYLGLVKVFSRLDSVAEPADLQLLETRHLAGEVLSRLGQAPDERDLPVFGVPSVAEQGELFPWLRPRLYRFGRSTDCTLYWRGADEAYTEERSAHHSFILDGSVQSFVLPLGLDVSGLTSLRFDVATRPGCFELYELELVDPEGGRLWRWPHTRDAVRAPSQMELVADADAGRSCFLSRGNDPQCELQVPVDVLEQLNRGAGLRVSLTAWPQDV